MNTAQSIKIKLSPGLCHEHYTMMYDGRDLTDPEILNELSPAEVSLYKKLDGVSKEVSLSADEAKALYNDLWSMDDILYEQSWDDFGLKQILRAARNARRKLLENANLQLDERGWAK